MRKLINFIMVVSFMWSSKLMAQVSVDYNWQNVVIGGGGFVSSIIADPNDQNIFYARTDVGGAYRWNEATQSWIPLLDWVSSDQKGYLGVDGIAIDPNVPGRVYMLLGIGYLNDGESAFVRSDDYGNTWEVFDITSTFKAHGNGMGRSNGERLAVDPNNSNIIFAGTRYNGLWKSTNLGTSWTQLSLDYTPNIDRGIHESGVCTIVFDKSDASGGVTQTIYAGLSRETNNVFVSNDGGNSWSLINGQPTTAEIRPQRMALTSDGRYLYITYGNGGGPHPMLWDGVTDYFNRGAVYKYDTEEGTWTDISPENFMQDLDYIEEGDDQIHYGAYSGISIDPNNENRVLATSINSWRAPQFWYIDGSWVDSWGDNIYLSEDGGETWREMFRYYWMDGGYYPDYEMINENGYPWIIGEKIHWNGAIVIDPFNSNRAFVPSGNGIFSTNNLLDYYTTTEWVDGVQDTLYHGKATWKFTSAGVEETVPLDLVSLPDGPLVSVIGDYDGFVHEDLDEPSQYGRLPTTVNGAETHLGTTTGLAYAAQNPDIMAKASSNSATVYNNSVSICGVQLSSDGGLSWNQIYAEPTGVSVTPAEGTFFKGEVAISADGAVVYWSPMSKQSDGTSINEAYHPELFRYVNSGWSKCTGVEFSCDPEADFVNVNVVYAYNPEDGYMYVSEDKGENFEQRAYVGIDGYKTMRAVPDHEGDIWIPLGDGGLARSTDAGVTFSTISNVTWCEAIGFGKEADGADFPTVFIYGTIGGTTGVLRSTDQGASWVRVNDDEHEYGGPGDASLVIGDMNVFGRVYMTTAGRGIVYGEPTGTTVSVTGITVSPTSVTVSVGGTTQLSATVSPSNATNTAVTWTSSNSNIATVSSTGLVTGIAAGTVTITVTTVDGGYEAFAQVDVSSVAVTGVSVTPTSVTLDPGETYQLSATVSPSDASNQDVNWSSGDVSIATVDDNGLVTAVSNGTTDITVTTDDGGYTASATITVNYVDIPVTGVELTPSSLTVSVDGTGQLTATVLPTTANNQVVYFSTSDASVATVDETGLVTGIAEGTATITVTTDDGNYTAEAIITVIDGGTTLCEDPVSISIPFSYDGAGQYCWVTTTEMDYVNSWNLNELTINGVDYTNMWSNDLPEAINGEWIIYYDGSYPWSHFEIPQAKSAMTLNETKNMDEISIEIYPNPFSTSFSLVFSETAEISSIEIIDKLGKTLEVISKSEVQPVMELGNDLSSGVYYVILRSTDNVQTFIMHKY